jgi:hypothetical protein
MLRGAKKLGFKFTVAASASPLDFLCAVYRDAAQPMNRRLKAASEAAQYVHLTFIAAAMSWLTAVSQEGLKPQSSEAV